MTKWIRYGLEEEDYFYAIYPHPGLTKMCLGKEPTNIYKIEFEECKDGRYWGWQENDDEDIEMIFAQEMLFNMCFPYGLKAELERGRGRVVRLNLVSSIVEAAGATYY